MLSPVGHYSGVRPSVWDQIDQSRRWLGNALDAMGLGPIETPSRVAFRRSVATLKAYGNARRRGAVVLLVPAPIKRAYIWDLAPWASVVQRCLRSGLRTYLIQWEPPSTDQQGLGLAEYADEIILECLQVIGGETEQHQVFLAGHSLGGTLAAIFSALHPEQVQGLVLLGAPLHFGPRVGAFGPVTALSPPGGFLTRLPGNVPGSLLDVVSYAAAPVTFGWCRWIDYIRSLADPQALRTHIRVERWSLDELSQPGRLYEEIVELLYRGDRLMRGTLLVGGRRVSPELVRAPLLSVVQARCAVAPPDAVLPFHEAAASAEKRLLWYAGDTGVALQHVGMLVGKTAHESLWPEILRWIRARSSKARPQGEQRTRA